MDVEPLGRVTNVYRSWVWQLKRMTNLAYTSVIRRIILSCFVKYRV